MRRIASITFIGLVTFGAGSSAAEAAAVGPASAHHATVSVLRTLRPATGRGTINTRVVGWHPRGAACIICWNSGR